MDSNTADTQITQKVEEKAVPSDVKKVETAVVKTEKDLEEEIEKIKNTSWDDIVDKLVNIILWPIMKEDKSIHKHFNVKELVKIGVATGVSGASMVSFLQVVHSNLDNIILDKDRLPVYKSVLTMMMAAITLLSTARLHYKNGKALPADFHDEAPTK